MDHQPLPTDVRRKLEQAIRWLRSRDPRLARCLASVEICARERVILTLPEAPSGPAGSGSRGPSSGAFRGRILVNPDAIRDLPPDVVAGALVSSLLVLLPADMCSPEGRSRLRRRAERVRRRLQPT